MLTPALRELAMLPIRNLLALGACSMAFTGFAADASAECGGCSVYLPLTSAGTDDCWTVFWSAQGSGGGCVWSAPQCLADGQCDIDVTWAVVPTLGAPSSCAQNAAFDWTATWGNYSSGSGTTSQELTQTLQNLRLACGTDFVLVVTSRATNEEIGGATVICTSCSA